jgi:tetratricopeptide (TPR) repeat protein
MEAISRIIRRSVIPALAAFPTVLALTISAQADTIELITGEVIEGKIQRETGDTVIIKTRFSESIMEDRPVPKDKIKKITKVKPDDQAFAALKEIRPPVTAFTPADYDPILKPFRDFLEKFGYSSNVQNVREMLREMEAEQKQIADGAVKLNGRIVKPEEMGVEAVEIEKHRKIAQINQMAQRGDLAGAINEFFSFAKENSGSTAYVDAVDQARGHLRALMGLLDHQMRNHPILEKRREEQLGLASPANRASMEAARVKQVEELQSSTNRSKEAGEVIPPFTVFSMPSLQAAHAAAAQELQKLNSLDLEAMQRSVQFLVEAETFFEERELQASQQRTQQALEAWPENAAAQRFQVRVEQEIERRAAADEHQAQAVSEGFTSSTADPDSTPASSPEESTD